MPRLIDPEGPPTIVVFGCGVIGLTTAIKLLEDQHAANSIRSPGEAPRRQPAFAVHIIASQFPSDFDSTDSDLNPEYASVCAGAHHLSFAPDDVTDRGHVQETRATREKRWDQETFRIMKEELSHKSSEETGLLEIEQTEYYTGKDRHLQILEGYPNFQIVPRQQVPHHSTHSVTFTTLTITPSIYLGRLVRKFEALGGRLWRGTVTDWSHEGVVSTVQKVIRPLCRLSGVVLCVGLGAAQLQNRGLKDTKRVFPTRGQVVLVDAPWLKQGWTRQVGQVEPPAQPLSANDTLNSRSLQRSPPVHQSERTYVIPRANGQVILGGTRDPNSWSREVDQDTTKDILKRVHDMMPDSISRQGTLQVVKSVVGFRPSRDGGARCESGDDLVPQQQRDSLRPGHSIPVVYNYGHGGAGWQSSWGCAQDASRMMLQSVSSRAEAPLLARL